MGREIRRVTIDWKHPKDKDGYYIPLFGRSFTKTLEEWIEGSINWNNGLRRDFVTNELMPIENKYKEITYEDWNGEKPEQADYMPEWDEEDKTHYQMYETCTEGTPISPVMKTKEELAKWLFDNRASFFGDMEMSYEHWLDICNGGIGLPMIVINR